MTPGTASRIMTGAPIPEGADAVVPVEQTELIDDAHGALAASRSAGPAKTCCRSARRCERATSCFNAGAVMRPIEIAILAEIGHGVVDVQPRPRVAVLPTGNELVPVGETPAAGQIRNSNGPMLVAAANRAGADAIELGIARDDRDELRRKIEQGLAADVLVLSGGVSAGKFDSGARRARRAGRRTSVSQDRAAARQAAVVRHEARRHAPLARVWPARQSGEQLRVLRAVRAAGDCGPRRPRLCRPVDHHRRAQSRIRPRRRPRGLLAGPRQKRRASEPMQRRPWKSCRGSARPTWPRWPAPTAWCGSRPKSCDSRPERQSTCCSI